MVTAPPPPPRDGGGNLHKEDLQNAATLCAARYRTSDDDMMDFLNRESNLNFHTLNQVVVEDDDFDLPRTIRDDGGSSLSYVLAYGVNRTVLYVAVRGGLNRRDWIALLAPQAVADKDDDMIQGRVHAGCASLAKKLLLCLELNFNQIKRKEQTKIQRVVFAGHSMGGAIAALTAALFSKRKDVTVEECDEMEENDKEDDTKMETSSSLEHCAWDVTCITFGAPYFANHAFRQDLCDATISTTPRFEHYRGANDVVPTALIHLSAFRNFSERETLTLLPKIGLESDEDDCSHRELCGELVQLARNQATALASNQQQEPFAFQQDNDDALVEIGNAICLEDPTQTWEPRHKETSMSSFFALTADGMKHHDMNRYLETTRTMPAHAPVLAGRKRCFVSRGRPKPAKRRLPEEVGAFDVIVLLPLIVGCVLYILQSLMAVAFYRE